MEIQSIETDYAGVHFRSRLEARWAVFFDVLQIEWLYEPKKIRLRTGINYIPDFYLAEFNRWIEIKPDMEFIQEWKSVPFARTDIPDLSVPSGMKRPAYCIGTQEFRFFGVYTRKHPDSIEVWFPELYIMRTRKGKTTFNDNNKVYGLPVKLDNAITRARQARFEHSETGQ